MALTDREKVIALAGVMGWPCVGFYDYDRKPDTVPRLVEQFGKPDGERGWFLIDGKDGRTWCPLESIADAFEVQAQIPVLGAAIRRKYTQALNRIVWGPSGNDSMGRDWAMVNATARQRMDAVLAALESER